MHADEKNKFILERSLKRLSHYLPAQGVLKDFIHHNTLHAFQDDVFPQALLKASRLFGYRVYLPMEAYRERFRRGEIREEIIDNILKWSKDAEEQAHWKELMLKGHFPESRSPLVGELRAHWKKGFRIDLDNMVHPLLFRILCSYLDQGVALHPFPDEPGGFLESLRAVERTGMSSFFRKASTKKRFLNEPLQVEMLLKEVVGDEDLFEQYLFDQQFAHQGWSGLVAQLEERPGQLLSPRGISLEDLIAFELLLEVDALEYSLGNRRKPLSEALSCRPPSLFSNVHPESYDEVLHLWQQALEWSWYDQVLGGIIVQKKQKKEIRFKSFQAVFCIDDREGSFRRHLETLDPDCETFGTAGFFNVDAAFRPFGGKHTTKICPAPVQPKHVIHETDQGHRLYRDVHFTRHSHSIFKGWIISQTLGFWSAMKLFLHLFSPSLSPASTHAFQHHTTNARLSVACSDGIEQDQGLQVGYTVAEMTARVSGLLKSIGLVKDFASLVYVVGHGASSVNNPHYTAYDCGACSGRAGSVNARAFAFMANHPEVRALLCEEGIIIPEETRFVGGIRDTTRDEIQFFDETTLSAVMLNIHGRNLRAFYGAGVLNARERSRRFDLIDSTGSPERIHELVKRRSVSLFEPRPELNHANNSLCIVGRRELSRSLFMDRRAFLNSYDYRIDPEGVYLAGILNAVAPVCGGINLEYYFSRVDNEKLGAGSKLPHNVMGLIGVANGIDGDLRPGLPAQMIELHDPLRLLVIVEQKAEVVLKAIKNNAATFNWFEKGWIHLAVIDPEDWKLYRYFDGEMRACVPVAKEFPVAGDIDELIRRAGSSNCNVHFVNSN